MRAKGYKELLNKSLGKLTC